MVSAGPSSFMGAPAPEEQQHDPEQKKALHKQLSQSFPEEAIERTDGRQIGKRYSTTGIKAQFVIDRLNEVLGIRSWRTRRKTALRELTTNSGRKAYKAVCDLMLELGERADGSFVAFAEALADGGHISMSEADARRAASAIRKRPHAEYKEGVTSRARNPL